MVATLNTINFSTPAFKASEKKEPEKPLKEAPKPAQTDVLDDFVKEGTTPIDNNIKSTKSMKKLLKKSLNTWQNFLKFKARATEYTKGAINGVISGLGVGASVMALDWAMNGVARVSKKEASSTMFIKEPANIVGRAFKQVFKTIYHLPDLTLRQIAYHTVHAPVDLFNYVKNAKNVTKIGKCFAPLLGGAAMAYSITKSVLKANNRVADIEHAFNSGHAHDLK